MNITKRQLTYGAGLLLTGLLLGWLLFPGSADHEDHNQLSDADMDQHVQHSHTDEQGSIIYTCSMHPQIRENEPGNCPICGMELIPADSGITAGDDDYSMVMTEASMKLAQVQTAPAEYRVPERTIHLPGQIKTDERRITRVTAHIGGRIVQTHVGFTGAPIGKGEPMAAIYSPELISGQRELLEAARHKDRNPQLYESARQKFLQWEFTEEQIHEIEQQGEVQREIEILAPVNGFVLSRNISNQQHVSEGTIMYEVANLDQVWVVLEAYEEDIQWLQPGDSIRFQARNQPGQWHDAAINYIDPVVDSQKRTVGVRADVLNPENNLKPGMLVNGTVHSRPDQKELLVPASAVLWTGPRSLVYVKDTAADSPRFEAREVELGPRAGDFYIIAEGVEEGEEVVFNGNFRIDSEMQLADRFSMMNREPGSGTPAHNHEGMGNDSTMPEPGHSEHTAETDEGRSTKVKHDLSQLTGVYLDVKNALARSDVKQTSLYAEEMSGKLKSMGQNQPDGSNRTAWMEMYSNLTESVEALLVEPGNLEAQRNKFKSLSELMIEAVRTFGVDNTVYHQYCPMADASWLSSEEQIQNPFMPESMPGCGEVIEKVGD